ncbi:MAG: hypothetical protein WBB26_08835, partial [Saprospiraceae bacterium]
MPIVDFNFKLINCHDLILTQFNNNLFKVKEIIEEFQKINKLKIKNGILFGALIAHLTIMYDQTNLIFWQPSLLAY